MTTMSNTTADVGRVRTIVSHLVGSWCAVLRQLQYIETIGDTQPLVAALENTWAAHVHNALGAVLIMDLIRAAGAVILDRRSDVASLARAVALLERDITLRALVKEQTEVKPGRYMDEATAESLSKGLMKHHAQGYYKDARADLAWIKDHVLNTDIAVTVEMVRHMAVAHNAIVFDGARWQLWRVEQSGLTYGQLDIFIGASTEAIVRLGHLVLHQAHAFDVEREHAQRWATEYAEALTLGLQQRPERMKRNP